MNFSNTFFVAAHVVGLAAPTMCRQSVEWHAAVPGCVQAR